MVEYTFCCRRCGARWTKGSARDVVRLVKCPSCGHDRIDYDCTHPPPPPADQQPFILGANQRLLLVFSLCKQGKTTVDHLAGLMLKTSAETRESLNGLAKHRIIELSDDGDVSMTELGFILAVNLRALIGNNPKRSPGSADDDKPTLCLDTEITKTNVGPGGRHGVFFAQLGMWISNRRVLRSVCMRATTVDGLKREWRRYFSENNVTVGVR